MRATLAEPTVGDRQLRLSQILALIIGVDHGIKRDASDLKAAVLDVVDGFVEQHLIGLLSILGDRVVVLLPVEAAGREDARDSSQNKNRTEHFKKPALR